MRIGQQALPLQILDCVRNVVPREEFEEFRLFKTDLRQVETLVEFVEPLLGVTDPEADPFP
ncbi:hypothetical protein BOC57_18845 [Burkholderia pseudomallei]|nr:hypothetical protein BOC57_18845 [Burkholderia pseudomallei]